MLGPDQRELLTDALRPPDGYRFHCGICTTFTLDLLTLLAVPVALAGRDTSDAASTLADPVLLLDGLRREADRLTVFCQAGRIAIPPPDNYLLGFLEDRIVQVRAPRGGVFHPKAWLLRYVPVDTNTPPFYRLLNLSRNLTFDRSWDLVLRLEGHVATHRTRAYGRNNPLGDFVRDLPTLALYSTDRRRVEDQIDLLQNEVRRVDFHVPDPFHNEVLFFHPFGMPGYRRHYQFGRYVARAMVVSPFLSDRVLEQSTPDTGGHVLVSRPDSIAGLRPETRARFTECFVLDDMRLTSDQEEADATMDTGAEAPGTTPEPSGLHAKLLITESGWDATWLVGSANATDAAFGCRNVELMVELKGRRSQVGIDVVLGSQNDDALRCLLVPYAAPESMAQTDESAKQAEKLADRVRDWLLAQHMRLEVSRQDDDCFDLRIRREKTGYAIPRGRWQVTCWPVTLRAESEVTIEPSSSIELARFAGLSLLAITPFVAFRVQAHTAGAQHSLRFVLKLPVTGLPDDRMARLFSAIIADRSQFLHFLWLILGEGDMMPSWLGQRADGFGGTWAVGAGDLERPLLEELLRAVSRSPDKIGRIAELVNSLRHTPEGRQVLPEGFDALWDAVLQVQRSAG